MTSRLLAGLFLASASAMSLAFAGSGDELLKNYTGALKKADGLAVVYTVTQVGKASERYQVTLAKPGQARLDTPTQVIVADGSTVSFYLKKDNAYYKKPQTDAVLTGLFADPNVALWAPFFNVKALKPTSSKDEGTRTIKGTTYNVLSLVMTKDGKETVRLYLNQNDSVLRLAQMSSQNDNGTDEFVLNTESLVLSKPSGDNTFAFNPPSGSKEIKESDLVAGQWLTDFNEALKLAKATNSIVLVDFYTDWCHWCKVLDEKVYPTEQFKKAAAGVVLCKINAEKDTALAQQYKVNAYPMIVFVNSNGQEIHRVEGYEEVDKFCQDVETAKSKK